MAAFCAAVRPAPGSGAAHSLSPHYLPADSSALCLRLLLGAI
jgi:hypothetical protein